MTANPAAPATAPSGAAPGATRERGYRRVRDRRDSGRLRFWTIAYGNLQVAWRSRWVKLLLVASLLPGVMLGGFTYFVTPLSRGVLSGVLTAGVVFSFLVAAIVGTRLVCEDRRQGAFTVYFSRPISRADYVGGKFVALFLPLLVASTAPGLIPVLVELTEPDRGLFGNTLPSEEQVERLPVDDQTRQLFIAADPWGAAGDVVVYGLLVSAATAGLVLGLSALAARARTATTLWFGVFGLGHVASLLLRDALDEDWPSILSWGEGMMDVANHLVGTPTSDVSLEARVFALVLAGVAGMAAVWIRLSTTEEVGGR